MMKRLLLGLLCVICAVLLLSCRNDSPVTDETTADTSLSTETFTPPDEEPYDPWNEKHNPPTRYFSPYEGIKAEPFQVDGVVWLNRPDWDGKATDDCYDLGTLVQFKNLKSQFKAYEDQPEQKFAVTLRYHLSYEYDSSQAMRQSPEHQYAVENGLTWNGLDADTALDLYDRHRCFSHDQETDNFNDRQDELLCQYLNVILQDQYAEYRRNGMQVIELYRTDAMPYIPQPVLIIGTKEQILSIKNNDSYIWYVGLAIYHPEIMEASYADHAASLDEEHICYNPQVEYTIEYLKRFYELHLQPMGYSKSRFVLEFVDEWVLRYYNTYSDNWRIWLYEEDIPHPIKR